MPADVFFDASVLIYAVVQDADRARIAEEVLAAGGSISVHVLNDLVAVMRRKLRMPWKQVLETTDLIRSLCATPVPLTLAMHVRAMNISQRYKYQIYDALVIAAALERGCSVLYSEDMQGGQVIETLQIRNPFRARRKGF